MSPSTNARFGRSAASAVLALALVGCNASTPSASPTALPPTAPPTPAPTPRPTSTPAPTPIPPTPEPTYPTHPESTAPWTSFPSLLQARVEHTATALRDGRILVVGGAIESWDANGDLTSTTLASVEIYRPESGRWEAGPPLHAAREDHQAVLLPNGRVLVFGGRVDVSTTEWKDVTSAEEFDPTTERWTTVAGPPTTDIFRKPPITLSDGTIFMLGSFGSYPDDQMRPVIFDPATSTWRRGARAPEIRIGPSLAQLADGSILVAGGAFDVPDGPPNADSIVFRYDVSKDTWTQLKPMPAATFAWAGFVMPGGDVLLIGDAAPMRYQPATNFWTLLAPPRASRDYGGVVRLADGRFLAAGSQGCGENSEAAEIYDPVANTWTSAGTVAPGDGSTLVVLADGRAAMMGGYWECQAYYTHEMFGNVSVLDPSAVH